MPDLGAIGGWVVAVLTVTISAVVSLFPKKGSLEHQMLDQQQERIDALERRIDRIEPMLVWYQRRDIAWERYVSTIKTGAERGVMPPWPDLDGILAEVRND